MNSNLKAVEFVVTESFSGKFIRSRGKHSTSLCTIIFFCRNISWDWMCKSKYFKLYLFLFNSSCYIKNECWLCENLLDNNTDVYVANDKKWLNPQNSYKEVTFTSKDNNNLLATMDIATLLYDKLTCRILNSIKKRST